MRLRHLAGAAVGGIGLAAASHRLLRARAGDLPAPLAGTEHTYSWRGFDVAYTEAGDPADPDLLLLHGINAAASSREFRDVFADLARDHHVIAPDLPGFGRSDRPPLLYSGSLYVRFVEEFAADVASTPSVVAASLSGAYAAVAAQSVPVDELFLVCPTATTMPDRRTWLRTLLRSPVAGDLLFDALTSERAIRYFNADHGFYDDAKLTDDLVEYQWRTAHQPGGRFAPASFVAGFLDLDVDLGRELAALDVPVTLVWGRQAETTPLEAGTRLAHAGDARLVVFDEARLQPHVEHPEQFARQVVRGKELPDAAAIEIENESDGEH